MTENILLSFSSLYFTGNGVGEDRNEGEFFPYLSIYSLTTEDNKAQSYVTIVQGDLPLWEFLLNRSTFLP